MKVEIVSTLIAWLLAATLLTDSDDLFGRGSLVIALPIDATKWSFGLGGIVFAGIGLLIGYTTTLRFRLERETQARLASERAAIQAEMEAALHRADRLATVGTFAVGVAHEINNPLTFLLVNLELIQTDLDLLLADEAIDAETRANLRVSIDDARDGAERIEKIMRELKLFVREHPDALAPVDLAEVMATSAKLCRHELQPGTELELRIESVPKIRGDAGKLAQVFVNLLVNAAHAIPEDRGHGRIVLELIHRGGEVIASVTDDGEGMTDDVRQRVFEPFFTTKPIGIGTGLGLAVCASIVRNHGGTLEFETEHRRGTTFRVRLPVYEG